MFDRSDKQDILSNITERYRKILRQTDNLIYRKGKNNLTNMRLQRIFYTIIWVIEHNFVPFNLLKGTKIVPFNRLKGTNMVPFNKLKGTKIVPFDRSQYAIIDLFPPPTASSTLKSDHTTETLEEIPSTHSFTITISVEFLLTPANTAILYYYINSTYMTYRN